jgi:integrase
MSRVDRPRGPKRLPVVLSPDELTQIFATMEGEHRLFAQLLYGTGLRINEGLRLRVKDVDFERRAIVVREGKGGKDRVVMLPLSLVPALRAQLARAAALWRADNASGRGGVEMPERLRHPHGTGVTRPLRRVDHDDLHPRAQCRGRRGTQPGGCLAGAVDCASRVSPVLFSPA